MGSIFSAVGLVLVVLDELSAVVSEVFPEALVPLAPVGLLLQPRAEIK